MPMLDIEFYEKKNMFSGAKQQRDEPSALLTFWEKLKLFQEIEQSHQLSSIASTWHQPGINRKPSNAKNTIH